MLRILQIIKLLSDLSEERRKTLELQERLQSILSANTEMRATAALQVNMPTNITK